MALNAAQRQMARGQSGAARPADELHRRMGCIAATSPDGFAVPSASKGGIFAATMGGWLRYIPNRGEPHVVIAEAMPRSFAGYSSVEVVNWEGDGDLDFIGGNETGFVQLIENVSTPTRTQSKTARKIRNGPTAKPSRPMLTGTTTATWTCWWAIREYRLAQASEVRSGPEAGS